MSITRPRPDERRDLELVRLIGTGDEDAALQFDRLFRSRLEYLASKASVAREDCRDIAQDVLLSALTQIRDGAFRGESSLATWLQGILSNKIADYWRQAQRRPGLLAARGGGGGSDAVLVEAVCDPSGNQEIALSVREALAALPTMHRFVLVLNQQGHTTEQIATRLRRPAGTIGRVLAEAKKMFRRTVRGEEIPDRRRLTSGAEQ